MEEGKAAVPKREEKRGLAQKFNEDERFLWSGTDDTACRAPAAGQCAGRPRPGEVVLVCWWWWWWSRRR